MPDEERLGGVVLEDRHLDVTPWVDVEGLVGRADGIEESKTGIAGDQLVVPLEEGQDGHGRVAPVAHEAAGEPEHLRGALVDHTSVAEDHRRSGPSGGLRQPDDARHRLAALHLEPDASLDNTALADFLDYLHGLSALV